MPYKHTELLIPEKHDKRVKLSHQDKMEIYDLYAAGLFSQRKLAAAYGVSRRLITYIIDPDKQKANYAARVARGGSKQYYKKEKHTAAIKKHRQHKQKLYLKGELENGTK